jgi:hypothetical protein
MRKKLGFVFVAAFGACLVAGSTATGQIGGPRMEYTATAIVSSQLRAGAGTVEIQVDRWSTDAERTSLVRTLMEDGPDALLEALRDTRSAGHIRTPDSIGYPLHYAHRTRGEDGGWRVVVATDRPIGFWEAWERPRTVDYPFTIVQMHINPDGTGSGTMSYATKVRAYGETIELENFESAPVMLNNITARPLDE